MDMLAKTDTTTKRTLMAYQSRADHKTPPKRQAEIKDTIESKGIRLTPCSLCLHE